MAYSANDKTTFRGGVGRSFGRVTVIAEQQPLRRLHRPVRVRDAGFGRHAGVLPRSGLPAYPLPPRIDPTFSNNNAVDWFNGQAATRPAVYDNWTISMQRELRRGLTVEVDYNGVYGSDLQADLINPNQVPMSVVNDLVARYGPDRRPRPAELADHVGGGGERRHPPPYPNFTNPSVQTSRTVAQALRPYPQYQQVNVQTGGGDKTGKSHYHAGVVKVNQRTGQLPAARRATRTRRS